MGFSYGTCRLAQFHVDGDCHRSRFIRPLGAIERVDQLTSIRQGGILLPVKNNKGGLRASE